MHDPRAVELVGGPHDGPTSYYVGGTPPESIATALVPCACGASHVEVWEPYETPPVPTVPYVLAEDHDAVVTYIYERLNVDYSREIAAVASGADAWPS